MVAAEMLRHYPNETIRAFRTREPWAIRFIALGISARSRECALRVSPS